MHATLNTISGVVHFLSPSFSWRNLWNLSLNFGSTTQHTKYGTNAPWLSKCHKDANFKATCPCGWKAMQLLSLWNWLWWRWKVAWGMGLVSSPMGHGQCLPSQGHGGRWAIYTYLPTYSPNIPKQRWGLRIYPWDALEFNLNSGHPMQGLCIP
jgi:hypothetical protein